MILFLLISLFILLFGVKFSGIGKWHEDFLSLSISKGLQGICAVLIILHHISQILAEGAGPLSVLENAGVCFVGVFFFFSGFGLLKSLNEKPDYLHHFFRKRLPVILVPFYVIILVFLIFHVCMQDEIPFSYWISFLTGWELINSHMWYIVEIFFLYIMFYLVFHYIKKRTAALMVMGSLVLLLTAGSLLLGHGEYWFQGEWWFNTTFLFVIGMLAAQYEMFLTALVKKFYLPFLFGSGILTVLLGNAAAFMLNTYSYWSESEVSMAYADKFRCLAAQLPFVISFVLFLLILTMKIQFKNRMLKSLGSVSLELYLIHNLFLEFFIRPDGCLITNPILYTATVLLSSLLAAYLLHRLDQKLIICFKKHFLP